MERYRIWVPRCAAAIAFCAYATLAAPGLYWLDAGELSAAAVRLGSPHPTGFPLYCALGKLASLVPVGELAFRLNLLSAACAALAVLWIARLVTEIARDDAAAVAGGAAAAAVLAASLVLARQATVAEVYAPTAALIAAAMLLVSRVARGGEPRAGLALALVCGLGAGLHVTIGLIAAPAAALCAWRLYRGARWPLAAPLVFALAAAGTIAYLPVRSATGRVDAIDWGHPRRAGALIDHLSAARYRDAYAGEMRSVQPDRVAHNASAFARDAVEYTGPLALLAAAAGLAWLVRRRGGRWIAAALGCVIAGDAAYAIWIHPWGTAELQNGVPGSLGVCAAAGVGVAWLARALGRAGPFAGAACAVIAAIPPALLSVPEVWPAARSDLPRAWSQAALDRTPPRGVALVENDSTASGLLWLTAAEGARPDVAVIVRQHMAGDPAWTRAALAGSGSDVSGVSDRELARPLPWLLASGRPLAWELGATPPPPSRAVVADAPLARLVAPGSRPAGVPAPPDDVRAAVARLVALFGSAGGADNAREHRVTRGVTRGAADRNARRVRAVALKQLGVLAHGRGDLARADVLFAEAHAADPGHAAALVNRGVVAAARRDFAAAAEHTERALAIEPDHVGARINAARYRLRLGDDAQARAHVDRALGLAPDRAAAWALAALLDLRAGDRERALVRLRRALELDPRDRDAVDLARQLDARRQRAP